MNGPAAGLGQGAFRVLVLGAAAGGGVPQWNCACPVCAAAWGDPALHSGQVSLAVTGDGGAHWVLINASPDLRQQIAQTPELHPRPSPLRNSPIAGVILTNGEVDAVAGLLSMREGQAFGLYAHRRVLDLLEMNPIFNVLDRTKVPRIPIETATPFEPTLPGGTPLGLTVEAFDVPGKIAWYMEGQATADAGDTLGLTIRPTLGGPAVHILTACARIDDALRARLHGADLVFFDGTLWTDDEMIRAGLSHKTGQAMGHISMSGPDGSIAGLQHLDIARKVFVHINNSNPALLPGAPERDLAHAAGWELPTPGQVFTP